MERGAYKISEEIVIDRAITIQGDALMLPMIDCKQSVRGFRVKVCVFTDSCCRFMMAAMHYLLPRSSPSTKSEQLQ